MKLDKLVGKRVRIISGFKDDKGRQLVVPGVVQRIRIEVVTPMGTTLVSPAKVMEVMK